MWRNKNMKILNKTLFIFCLLFCATAYSQEDAYKAVCDQMPEPVGGYEAIYKSMSYPEMAKKAGIQGKVYLLAYINEKGGVDDVKVVKSLGGGCDEAAVEAVKKTKFTQGKLQGQSVKVKLTIPINFKLKF